MNFIAIIVIVVLTVLLGGCVRTPISLLSSTRPVALILLCGSFDQVWYLYKNMDALIGDSDAGDTSRGVKKATEKTGLLGSRARPADVRCRSFRRLPLPPTLVTLSTSISEPRCGEIDSWGGNSEEDKKLLGGGHASEAENKRLANL